MSKPKDSKKQDKLHSLIASLTKAEKRYFKLFSSLQKGDKNYLKLFEYIDNQENYDKTAAEQHFRGQAFAKQLHVTKNYLFKLILKSLHQYNLDKNVRSQAEELLAYARILNTKKMPKEAIRYLKKAKNLVEDFQLSSLQLEIVALERAVMYTQLKPDDFKRFLEDNKQTVSNLLAEIENEMGYYNLYYDFLHFNTTTGILQNKDQAAAVQGIIEHPFMQNAGHARTFLGRCYYYIIWANYHWFKSDLAKRYETGQAFVSFMEDHPQRLKEHNKFYAAALQIQIANSLFLEKYDGLDELLSKYKSLPSLYDKLGSENLRERVLPTYFNLGLNYYRRTWQFEKAKDLIKEVELHFKHLKPIQQVVICDAISVLYFLNDDFEKSLDWLNKYLDEKYSSVRSNVQSYGMIRRLLLHYELGDTMLLPYLLRNTKRYLDKGDHYHLLESTLIEFFKRVINVVDKQERLQLFQGLKQQLQVGFANNQFKIPKYQSEDIMTWIESKVQGKSFREIMITGAD